MVLMIMLNWESASPAKTLSSKGEAAPPENNGTCLLGGSMELLGPQLKEPYNVAL